MEPTLSAYQPTWRDRIAQALMGDGRASPERRAIVEGLTGSSGLGTKGIGIVDALMVPGAVLGAQEAAQGGDYRSAAMAMMPAARIKGYHVSPHEFDRFKPSEFRGASFFASTPERASRGANAGANEMVMDTATKLPSQKMHTYEVAIDPTRISGLNLTPSELDWFGKMPERIVGDDNLSAAMSKRPNPYLDWEMVYEPRKVNEGLYEYIKRAEPPSVSYDDAIKSGRDVYGKQFSHYGPGADEKSAADRTLKEGMGGYLVNDEAGLSVAVADPSIIEILRKYGLTGLLGLGAIGGAYQTQQEGGGS